MPSLAETEQLNGLASDYRAFFSSQVDEPVKRAALKRLFTDPHFNAMDGLDVYVDDYSQFVPLTEAAAAASNSFQFIRASLVGPQGTNDSSVQAAGSAKPDAAAERRDPPAAPADTAPSDAPAGTTRTEIAAPAGEVPAAPDSTAGAALPEDGAVQGATAPQTEHGRPS